MQLAGNRLQQIARCQQALHHAVFIDHKHQTTGLFAKLLQQLHTAERFRHKHGRADVGRHRSLGLVAHIQQPGDADHAHDLIQRTPAHRVPGMAAVLALRTSLRQAVTHRAVRVQPGHVGARRHQRCQWPLVEAEHVLHHLVLMLFDHTGVHALFQAGADFFFRDVARRVDIDPQNPQGVSRGPRQQLDKGLGGDGQPQHGPRNPARHRFRVQLPDALGHQFAKNNRGEGDRGDHNRRGGDGCGTLVNAPGLQPQGQPVAECSLTHDAVEHANRCDAHLHRAQKLIGLPQQHQGGLRPFVPRLGHGRQTRFAACGQGQLGHGEDAIEQSQKNN